MLVAVDCPATEARLNAMARQMAGIYRSDVEAFFDMADSAARLPPEDQERLWSSFQALTA